MDPFNETKCTCQHDEITGEHINCEYCIYYGWEEIEDLGEQCEDLPF